MMLSVLIPVYNEEEFISTVLDRVLAAPIPSDSPNTAGTCEVIVVDDASTDGTQDVIREYIRTRPSAPIRFLRHEKNQGKGAAIRTALEHARGEYSIIQDADLEYNPFEYAKLMRPLVEGRADVVYGSRFLVSGERRVLYFWHALANRILTTLCNIAADLNLTDMETCYKVFRTSLVQSIPLFSKRFGIEPELTIKLAKRQARIYEVPIDYNGRTYEEGKKIGARDAVAALAVILRCWFSNNIYKAHGPDILDALSDAHKFNRWMADTISPYLGKDVLELGAGMGNLSRHLARKRRRYVATDIDEEHLARLAARLHHRPNISTCLCNLTQPDDFAAFTGRMDSVVCLNVLEHVEDDMTGLRNLHSCLAIGGRAIVLVPQGAGNFGTLDEALGHYRRYSKSELETKMKAAGFRVERILEFNRVTYPGWFVNGRILKRKHFSRFQLVVFDHLVSVWRRLDRFLPWPPTSIIGIGVKEAADTATYIAQTKPAVTSESRRS